MKIRHAMDDATGRSIDNTFVAVEGAEQRIVGEASVNSRMYRELLPVRPHLIAVSVRGDSASTDTLYGAATARARYLAKMAGVASQIRVECEPGNEITPEKLAPLGFREGDGLCAMRAQVMSGPVIERLPERCTIVMDDLSDELEAKYFLSRYNALFCEERDMLWLKDAREREGFKRLLMVSPDGLAGEAAIWTEGGSGVLGYFYTAPDYRRRGVAKYLLALARRQWAEAGLSRATCEVWLRLDAARQALASAGYRQDKIIKKYLTIDINMEERL